MVAALRNLGERRVCGGEPEPRRVVIGDVDRFAGDQVERLPLFVGERGVVGFGGLRGGGALEDLPDDGSGIGHLVEPDESVDFGEFLLELGGEALGHAAADDQFLAGAAFHSAGLVGLEDGFDGFFLGGVDECAGVHHQDVGFIGVAGDFHAIGKDTAKHDLCIHEVFGAAEADHADFGFLCGGWRRCGRHGEFSV